MTPATPGARARAALRARGLPDRARLVVTSPPYLRVVKYGYYNWLRTWFLGEDAKAIDAALDDAHHRKPYLAFMRDVLAGLRPALADDAIVVLVIGDVELDRGREISNGFGLAEHVWETAAAPEGYALAGIVVDPIAVAPQDDQAMGLRGRPGDEDRPHPRPGCQRGRPSARAREPVAARSRGTGRREASARSDRGSGLSRGRSRPGGRR